jgi:hypothetical protein
MHAYAAAHNEVVLALKVLQAKHGDSGLACVPAECLADVRAPQH